MGAILLRFWPYIAIATLVATNWVTYNLWQAKSNEFNSWKDTIEAFGKQAAEEKEDAEKSYRRNLTDLKDQYENQLPAIRSNAVAVYRRMHPQRTCGSALPESSAGDGKNDGAIQEPVVTEDEFIGNCAEDAAIREQYRQYCIRNKCPIEE